MSDFHWNEFWRGESPAVVVAGEASSAPVLPNPVLFPGAFNPLHYGHRRMAEIAEARLGSPVTFEISIENVDKPALAMSDARHRLRQFGESPVLLTRAATFVEKASLFPAATFLVGADTMARIGRPRYYGGDIRAAREAAERLLTSGCRFLVFGRLADGEFAALRALKMREDLAAACEEVTEEEFREDISSTQLRATRDNC